jgi:hypothetical protein
MARWAAVLLAGLATIWLVLATWLPFARLWYPFELEWIGGLVADHTARILDGKPLYVAPTADFVPLLYTPLYMYASAGMSMLVGEGFLALRLTSILAALVSQVLLFALVRAETRSRLAAWIASGVWSSSYFLVNTWWDAERVDSLFVAWLLASLLLLRRGKGLGSAGAAAATMVLAYVTKQTALPIACAFAVATMLVSPRRGLFFATMFAVLWGTTVLAADSMTGGWFSFYTWHLPNDHEFDTSRLGMFFLHDLLPMLPATVLAVWFFAQSFARDGWRATCATGAFCGGMCAASALSRCHQGSAVNVLMPAWLAMAATAGLSWSAACRARAPLERGLAVGLLALQFALGAIDFGDGDRQITPTWRDLGACLPTAADAETGHRLVQLLREADGPVIIPFHGYLPRMAGKASGAHAMAVYDVRGAHAQGLQERLHQQYLDSARDRNAALVVLDATDTGDIWKLVLPGYTPADRLVPLGDERTFVPRIGLPSRPILFFRRQP